MSRAEDTSLRQHAETALETLVALAALATVPLIIAAEQGATDVWLVVADWLVWGIFLADYVIMLALSRDRRGYARQNWLSVAVIVISFPLTPALLDLVRLTRFARLARLARVAMVVARGLEGIRKALGRREMTYVLAITVLLVVASAGALTIVEPQRVPGGMLDAIWWAIVTVTTTGYGDIAPATPWGRLVAVALMIVGLGLVATLGATFAAHFVQQDEEADIRMLMARLDRIERALQQLGANPQTGGADSSASRDPEVGTTTGTGGDA